MTSRERVLTALARGVPDRVPHCEIGIDRALATELLAWGAPVSEAFNIEEQPFTVEECKSIAAALKLDNINYVLRAPVFADKVAGKHGRLFYGDGQIKTPTDLARLVLPDPDDEALYREARRFTSQKGDYAAFFITRIGIFPTMLSMGMESFSVALFEDLPFVENVLDTYCDWALRVARRACTLGFDVFVSTDDMAYKTGPVFSPQVFHDLVLPRYRRVAEQITLPWVIHSDGNVEPLLPDLLQLPLAGLHPNEKGAMDIRAAKRAYGDRLCILGNLDLNLLGRGTPDEVDLEVRDLIRDLAPGGGYIITSGNSLAGYLAPENVWAFSRAVEKYGSYGGGAPGA